MTARIHGPAADNLFQRLEDLETRRSEARGSYAAGTSDRMTPIPRGVTPTGAGADTHYLTERSYFLMVERGRHAVRNHPLVEQGINRLIANLKIGEMTLDLGSGDPSIDVDVKAKWASWCGETSAGAYECDYEGTRSFQGLARQSFFSQVQDGDITHVPLYDGCLQTWESHNLRSPAGTPAVSFTTKNGMVHGVEVRNGRIVAYHVTPWDLTPGQSVQRRGTTRLPAYDEEGNRLVFWSGFRHRFNQRRGISRLSPPRDAMTGFDDLNYANIKSSLRRSLIAYLMEREQQPSPAAGFTPGQPAGIPQAGDRYAKTEGLGVKSIIIEQSGEPAQVIKPPDGYSMKGWNANLPSDSFFEHSALLLTMLSVNLDMPLMFLLLDGSLVNFHGGRMTFDQAKLRFRQLQKDQCETLWNPTYEWKIRQWTTPGSPHFDVKLFAAVRRGANLLNYKFRPAAWPYVKPLEDIAADDLAERRNLRSMRAIQADRNVDLDDHIEEVISDRGIWIRRAMKEAVAIQSEFPKIVEKDELPRLWREIYYGNETTGVQLAINAGESQPAEPAMGNKADAKKGK